MIVPDASVLIAHLNSADVHHQRATARLARDKDLAISVLTLVEVLVQPARSGLLAQAVSVLEQLNMNTLSLDESAAQRLALLRAETRLKLPDCCVLLAAEQVHGSIATFDERLASEARTLGLTVVDS